MVDPGVGLHLGTAELRCRIDQCGFDMLLPGHEKYLVVELI